MQRTFSQFVRQRQLQWIPFKVLKNESMRSVNISWNLSESWNVLNPIKIYFISRPYHDFKEVLL